MITALVCTRDRPALLAEALAALAAGSGDGDELLVVDAGDGPAGDVPSGTKVLRSPPGKSRQLNAGIRAAAHDVVVITDDDCLVPPGWPRAMAEAVRHHDDVGAAFGPVEGLSAVPGAPPPRRLPPGEAPAWTWEYAHGAAMAVRRSAVLAVGGFDESLGPGTAGRAGEDHDLALRLREAGWRVVVADAPPVVHAAWRSTDEERANARTYERGAGAVVGRALRRAPRSTLRYAAVRGRHQLQLLRVLGPRDGLGALGAFLGGLAYGMRRPS